MVSLVNYIMESFDTLNESESSKTVTVGFSDIGFYKRAVKLLKDNDYSVKGNEETKKIVINCEDDDDCEDVIDKATTLLNDNNLHKFTIK